MRDYSKVSQSLWESRRFVPLRDDLKLLYLYLLTCPHGNSIGCFRVKNAYIMGDLNWDQETCSKRLTDLSETGLIRVFEPENLVQIDRFLNHNPICNPRHAAGAARLALQLPECQIKESILNELLEQKQLPPADLVGEIKTSLERVSDGYSTETETETETITETETDSGGADAPAKSNGSSDGKKEYVFQGRVIRLVANDYKTWKGRFHAIPDFDAELQAADDYYANNPPPPGKNGGVNWFFPVSNWLKRSHEQALAKCAGVSGNDDDVYAGVD